MSEKTKKEQKLTKENAPRTVGRLQRLRAEQRVQLFLDLVKGPEVRIGEFRSLAPQGQAEELLKVLGGSRKRSKKPRRRTRAELEEALRAATESSNGIVKEYDSLKHLLHMLCNQLLNAQHEYVVGATALEDTRMPADEEGWYSLGTSALRAIEDVLSSNRSTLEATGQELIDKGSAVFELEIQLERATNTLEVLTYMARKVLHIPTVSD